MSKQSTDDSQGMLDSMIPAPKDDDGRAKEQDGDNRLLGEGDFNNRERMREHE
jgi:hypothetical protein